jgi:hypothetical protein
MWGCVVLTHGSKYLEKVLHVDYTRHIQ